VGTMNTQQRTITIVLLIVISLSITQNFALAQVEPKSGGSITIVANGTAAPIGGGQTQDSMLSLSGSASSSGGNAMSFSDLTGMLNIGQTSYVIVGGHGQSDQNGVIDIKAITSGTLGNPIENGNTGEQLELDLHGSIQGNSVTFDSQKSTLASLDALSLSGQVDLYLPSNGAASTQNANTGSGNEASTVTSSAEATSMTMNVTQKVAQAAPVIQPGTLVTVTITQMQNLTVVHTDTYSSGNVTLTVVQTTTFTNIYVTATGAVTVANQTVTVKK